VLPDAAANLCLISAAFSPSVVFFLDDFEALEDALETLNKKRKNVIRQNVT
jgi:hypothetical protein